jgi:hypothetical protein
MFVSRDPLWMQLVCKDGIDAIAEFDVEGSTAIGSRAARVPQW